MKTMTIKIKRDPAFVLKALKENNFMVIDDHNGRERQLEAAVIMESGDIVQFLDVKCQSFNGLYLNIKENKVHISRWSKAGVIFGYNFKEYNKEKEEAEKNFGLKMNKIDTIYWKDGRVENLLTA